MASSRYAGIRDLANESSAEPDRHMEAITSRPLLLSAIAERSTLPTRFMAPT
jgi:hypothetical protein